MRSLIPGVILLTLAAGCSRGPAGGTGSQTAPVALELLLQTGLKCDALGAFVSRGWSGLASVGGLALGDPNKIAGDLIRQAGPGAGSEIAILQREAKRRVDQLKAEGDPQADPLFELYAAARNHCAAVAYPEASSPSGYEASLQAHKAEREAALAKAQEKVPSRSAAGLLEMQEIYDRIRAETGPRQAGPFGSPPATSSTPSSPSAPAVGNPGGLPLTSDQAASEKQIADSLTKALKALSGEGGNPAPILEAWDWSREGQRIRVEGKVRNPANRTLELGRFEARFSSASDTLVESRSISLVPRVLDAGESTTFALVISDSAEIRRCRLTYFDAKGTEVQISALDGLEKTN